MSTESASPAPAVRREPRTYTPPPITGEGYPNEEISISAAGLERITHRLDSNPVQANLSGLLSAFVREVVQPASIADAALNVVAHSQGKLPSATFRGSSISLTSIILRRNPFLLCGIRGVGCSLIWQTS